MPGIVIVQTVVILLLLAALWRIYKGNVAMAQSVVNLREELTENTSVIDSSIVLISGLANRLREALLSESALEEVQALADELDANNQRLAAAVAANTLGENDSEEFAVEELDEGESADGVESDTEADLSSVEIDETNTVSGADVGIESGGEDGALGNASDAPDEGDDGEAETPSAA